MWEIRAGITIQLTDDRGISHQGEIAPISWFGSESIEQAICWCQQVGDHITTVQIHQIPDCLPACQFGFGSALTAFNSTPSAPGLILALSALLPSGAAAIPRIPVLVAQGVLNLQMEDWGTVNRRGDGNLATTDRGSTGKCQASARWEWRFELCRSSTVVGTM